MEGYGDMSCTNAGEEVNAARLSQLHVARIEEFSRLMCEPVGLDVLADEYVRLNAALGALTAVRSFLDSLSVRIPFESPIVRDERGLPVRDDPTSGMPRPLYRAARAAVVEAEHAVMRIRDRNGWSDAYEKYGKAS